MTGHARLGLWPFAMSAVLGACSTSPTTTDVRPGSNPRGDAPAQPRPCVAGPRYHAFLTSGSCADVEANGGTWVSRSTFPGAPAEISSAACTYQWIPNEHANGAPPDVAALSALGAEFLTKSIEEISSCEQPAKPASLALAPIPSNPSGVSTPTGVTGCDVCARVFERQVFVILPADDMKLRSIVVTTDTGQSLSFEVKQPIDGMQVFSAELPPAPNNARYRPSTSILLEAHF